MVASRFRVAALPDVDQLLPLIRAYYTLDGIAFDAVSIRRGLEVLLADPSLGGAWLLEGDSGCRGYFVMTFGFDLELGGRQATVTELYISPEHRRQGAGRATLLFVEETLRALGIGAFELQVEHDNHEARAFYEAFGMVAHARIPLSKKIAP